VTVPELDERSLTILEIEKRTTWGPGQKEAEVRARLDLGATRYYQLLNALIDTEAALAHDPLTVNRLRRTRTRFLRSAKARRREQGA